MPLELRDIAGYGVKMNINDIEKIVGIEQKTNAQALIELHEAIRNVDSAVMNRIFNSEYFKSSGFAEEDRPVIEALRVLGNAKVATIGWLVEMAEQVGGKNV